MLLIKNYLVFILGRDIQPTTLSSKIETQLPFGLEQLTRKEVAFDWIETMARPGSILARAHIGD